MEFEIEVMSHVENETPKMNLPETGTCCGIKRKQLS